MEKIGQREGVGLSRGHESKVRSSSDQALYEAIRAELDDIRAKYAALLAKMDADFADVANASTDYAASVPLSAKTFEK